MACGNRVVSKPLVIGIGNDFRRDDGAGRIAARRVREVAGDAIRVIEESGEGAALMDAWRGAESVVLIDAVHSGAKPGTVHRLDAQSQPIPANFFHYSTHAFSVAEAVELARALGQLPPRLTVYGIEGNDFTSGEGLSPEVTVAVEQVAQEIAKVRSRHNSTNPSDPFRSARNGAGVLECEFQCENVPMILRHEDVRRAAKDWKTFSSDAPFRVPIPSEEGVRTMRQLPIETDPPNHTEYREILEPFFRRAKDPLMIAQVEALIDALLAEALRRESIEVVREFALPLQSRALTYLLNVPPSEAETWISWGIHVFRDGGSKGAALETYLHAQLDRAAANPGDDFFSALTKATFRGRPLSREEMMGFANLTFAGGRDTIIHTISSVVAYLGQHPKALEFLREDPARIVHASEEFFRVISPLTHIGRVCPVETDVHGVTVKARGRVSLCWASANQDETIFDAPQEVHLDRKPNPHLAFGFGAHLCLGAPHARLLLRTLLEKCIERVSRITVLEASDRVEDETRYQRVMGYESLTVALRPI